jgi:hypothetical protein
VTIGWKEDDQDTWILFLETILDSYRDEKLSRIQAITRITEALTQGGLSRPSMTAYMQSVIQEHRTSHRPSVTMRNSP